ncbi:carbon storage regulator [Alteribacillus sp. HJP-4]|uniref:carbon storage regulator n=1 Tax=Alteribacillus sp. HJP-4 TaxID=2775394 RepID=UPI0035CD1119
MGLVISRREGQGIIIGDDIKITPLEKDGAMFRIHIEAPREVEIYREEIFEEFANQQLKDFKFNPVKSSKK